MRCLGCQYDLSKLPEHRCPECGRAFDPTDPKTFERHQRNAKTTDALLSVAMIMGFLLIVALTFWLMIKLARIVQEAVAE